MNYLQDLAQQIRDEVPTNQLPDGDTQALFLNYAVLVLVKGVAVTNEDVHNAWASWMSITAPDHESIQPYDTLPKDTQGEDSPFRIAIRRVAERVTL
jgi:hypothetical protein